MDLPLSPCISCGLLSSGDVEITIIRSGWMLSFRDSVSCVVWVWYMALQQGKSDCPKYVSRSLHEECMIIVHFLISRKF